MQPSAGVARPQFGRARPRNHNIAIRHVASICFHSLSSSEALSPVLLIGPSASRVRRMSTRLAAGWPAWRSSPRMSRRRRTAVDVSGRCLHRLGGSERAASVETERSSDHRIGPGHAGRVHTCRWTTRLLLRCGHDQVCHGAGVKAVLYERYGPPDVLHVEDVPVPFPATGHVRVKVAATSVNLSDWECLHGSPAYARIGGLRYPAHRTLGSDIAGVVDDVGEGVTRFRPGDEVYGDNLALMGGFAEYALAPESALAQKPVQLTFAEASTIPQAGAIALKGTERAVAGSRVLINGAGGGSGFFAIQLAKRLGARPADRSLHRGARREAGAGPLRAACRPLRCRGGHDPHRPYLHARPGSRRSCSCRRGARARESCCRP